MSRRFFRTRFAQHVPEDQADALYDKYIIPTPGKVYWDGIINKIPIRWDNPDRAPLLLIGGELDLIADASMTEAIYKKQRRAPSLTELKIFPGRTHWTLLDPGWEEVADFALEFRPAQLDQQGFVEVAEQRGVVRDQVLAAEQRGEQVAAARGDRLRDLPVGVVEHERERLRAGHAQGDGRFRLLRRQLLEPAREVGALGVLALALCTLQSVLEPALPQLQRELGVGPAEGALIGNTLLITGAVWANESWGRYWGWDAKEVGALVAWLTYAGFLHSRIGYGWKGRRSAYFAVVAFLFVVFTYLGVSYLLPGLHSYA